MSDGQFYELIRFHEAYKAHLFEVTKIAKMPTRSNEYQSYLADLNYIISNISEEGDPKKLLSITVVVKIFQHFLILGRTT
jgi:hypothetical protein